MRHCREIARCQQSTSVVHVQRLLPAPRIEDIGRLPAASGLDLGVVLRHSGVVRGGVGPARQHPRNGHDFRIVRPECLLAFGKRGDEQVVGRFVVVHEEPGDRKIEAGQGDGARQERTVPALISIAGQTTQWKRVMSLPMTCRSAGHQVSNSASSVP